MLRFLFILFFAATALNAQHVDPSFNHVIATSGINLRAAASTTAAVITAIPFGDRVHVFDKCSYSLDTLGRLNDFYQLHGHLDSLTSFEQEITGTWVRVAYGADTGFVFNAYLWYAFNQDDIQSDNGRRDDRADHHLIYPGGGCGGNLYDPKVYHFYGVYGRDESALELRKISVSYRAVVDEFESLLITTDDHKYLRFIIASKHRMKPHRFTGNFFDKPAVYHAYESDHDHGEHQELPPHISVDTMVGDYPTSISSVMLKTAHANQELIQDPGHLFSELKLNGMGDLDGDGQPDYLIELTAEENQVRLYLSGIGQKGNLELAATAYFFCCC